MKHTQRRNERFEKYMLRLSFIFQPNENWTYERVGTITSCFPFKTIKAHWKIYNENIKHIVENNWNGGPEKQPKKGCTVHERWQRINQLIRMCTIRILYRFRYACRYHNTWFRFIRSLGSSVTCALFFLVRSFSFFSRRFCVERLFIVKLSLISSCMSFVERTTRLWLYLWTILYNEPSDNIRNLLPLLLYDIYRIT